MFTRLIIFSGMVYDDAEQLYAEVRKSGFDLMEEAFGVLAPDSLPLNSDSLSKLTRASALFGYNTTFFPRLDLVKVPLTGSAKALGGSVLQTSKDGSEGYALFDCLQGGRLASLTEISPDALAVSGMLCSVCRMFSRL
jgi:alpha-mannosidase